MKQTTKNLATMMLPLAFGLGCATTGHAVRQQQQYQQPEEVTAALETMTAAGYFSVIDTYRNKQIDQHPDQYRNEMTHGAWVALKHAPNLVYELAIDLHEEDVHEYLDTRLYTLQHMKKMGGFAFSYDVNHDE